MNPDNVLTPDQARELLQKITAAEDGDLQEAEEAYVLLMVTVGVMHHTEMAKLNAAWRAEEVELPQ